MNLAVPGAGEPPNNLENGSMPSPSIVGITHVWMGDHEGEAIDGAREADGVIGVAHGKSSASEIGDNGN